MAKLPRETVVQFGAGGVLSDFGQFGSKKAGSPQDSQNPTIIMQLAAWATGWANAAVGAKFNPYLEDMNGFCLATFYFLANMFERGIPDWDPGTTYYLGAQVQDPAGSGQHWYSLQNNNLNNAPPVGASNAFWHWDNQPALVDGGMTVTHIPKISSLNPALAVNSALTDDGVNVKTTLPLKFPDNTVQSSAAINATPQTQLNETGTRAINITYQNTSTRARFVSVTINPAVGQSRIQIITDASPAPSQVVYDATLQGGATNYQIFFIVLPGNYYQFHVIVAPGNPAIINWTEWT